MSEDTPQLEGIAIVGLAGRFPGAADVRQFWANLAGGVESITTFSDAELRTSGLPEELRRDASYVPARGVLDHADCFDAAFFGFSPREAELTDPQHRVFLECAWHALEDAGLNPAQSRESIGVFAGASLNTYLLDNIGTHHEQLAGFVGQFQTAGYPTLVGNDKDYLATRVSYKLDLRGPSMTVQTACSTSLVAVVQALQALQAFQCDAALAGGVSITFPQARGHLFQEGSINSADGHCRAFDAAANGVVFGHGCGVVVLKRLADAVANRDHIYAVIKGGAVNNDGAAKLSYMAPSVEGQAEVISLAQALAGVSAETIDYVEAHGTGTPLGDPLEFAALTQAFRGTTSAVGFCQLGTVKSNVGHLEAAAGVAGLIKTALALEHAQIPPLLHFRTANSEIPLADSPFTIGTELRPWPQREHPRRAGVSSFGVGGTNAHLVLEAAPVCAKTESEARPQLLVLSAKTLYALEEATSRLAQHLKAHPELNLADVAFTLLTGRQAFTHRRFLVASDRATAAKRLLRRDRRHVFSSSSAPADASPDVLSQLGRQWLTGASLDAEALFAGASVVRVSLPGYPFERQRHWIEPLRLSPTPVQAAAAPLAPPEAVPASPLDALKQFLAEQSGLDLRAASATTSLLELGFDSLFLTQIAIALQRRYGLRITLRQLLGDLADLGPLSEYLEARRTIKGTSDSTAKDASRLVPPRAEDSLRSAALPAAPNQHGPFRALQKDLGGVLDAAQHRWLDELIAAYTARTPGSKKHTAEHRPHFADPRAVAGFKQIWKEMVYPLVVDRSAGAHLWDLDGNDYVDVTQGFGLALFGHQPRFVMEAIAAQMERGMEIGPSHPLAGEVAALLCELSGHERATFCNTGSEAVLGAIRIARTVTGRRKIAVFAGAYHGINDEALVRPLAANGEWRTVPIAPGILQEAVDHVLVLEYGNPASLEIIRREAGDLAAVLVEPVQSRRPDLQPREFLQQLRALTREEGVALIMDEVITGFRCHPGGAQAVFEVQGDIATYGKIIGGGLPIGAITGRAEYLDAFDGGAWQFGDDSYPTAGVTFFAGTFVRHPLALAAARAVLLHLKERGVALQNELSARTAAMIAAIEPALKGTPFSLPRFASIFFVRASDFKYSGLLYALLRHRGIHIWEGRPCFLGTAHTPADIDKVVTAFRESLDELRNSGFFNALPDGTKETEAGPVASNLLDAGITQQADDCLPLTSAQQEVWLASQLAPGARAAFNETCTLHFRGAFDAEAMRRAITEVTRRHDALRARFRATDGAQFFAATLEVEVPLRDWADLPPGQREAQIAELLETEGARPFDLENGPLVAWQMVRKAFDEHLLIFTAHHLACDGWSYDIVLRELAQLYTQPAKALPPAPQFGDVLRAETSEATADRASALAFWRHQFRTLPPVLDLPTDQPRPLHRTWAGARSELRLSRETRPALAALGAQHGATLFTVVLAGFNLLLHRLTSATDLVVGVPAAGQNLIEDGENLVGHYASLLPLRTQLDPAATVGDLLQSQRSIILDAFEHQAFTVGQLLTELPIPRDPSRVPLVSVTFNLDPRLSDLQFGTLTHELSLNPRRHFQFDLGFNLVDEDAGLRVECDYNPDLFSEKTIQSWLQQYAGLLAALPARAAQPLHVLDSLTAEVRAQVLEWGRGARTNYPAEQTIHALFASRAEETPDAVALIDGDTCLTYAELEQWSNRYGNWLRKQRLGPGAMIGIFGHRNWQFAASIIGILKVGAAYVPLDPRDPPARIAGVRTHLDAVLDEHLDVASESDAAIPHVGDPDAAAYVMFTSGSTGEPKGVVIPHRGVTRLVCANDYATLDAKTVMMQGSNLCFDASTFEIWGALLQGGRLIFTRTNTLLDPHELLSHFRKFGINTLLLTTSLFNQHVRQKPDLFAGLRCVVFGGEAADPSMVNQVVKQGRPFQLINAYGPTETTTIATAYAVMESAPTVPIGRPIANTDVFILGPAGQLLPAGASGEIHVAGPGLAIGYLHRPEFTQERFIESEFGRLYRTGDFGRWRADGLLEYQGRIDQQFKMHGFRIEPAEIEAQLRAHQAVAQCAVLPRNSPSGGRVPVAYLVRKATAAAVGEADFRKYLVSHLPPPLVPHQWFWLDALPLKPNGKLDERALPEPTVEVRPMREYVAARNPVEAGLVAIWEEVLRRQPIGIRDDFFELGGHSLLAIQLISRVPAKFGVDLPIDRLFGTPTIAGLAEYISSRQSPALPAATAESLIAIQRGDGSRRAFFLVPGGWGSEVEFLVYGALTRHLGPEQPLYGLKARGANGQSEAHRSVKEMVSDYLAEIRAQQPHGPYLLGGECVGGVVAYEMARRLELAGEEVALLVLLGTRPPGRGALRRFRKWERKKARQAFWEARVHQPWQAHLENLRRLPLAEKLQYVWQRAARKRTWASTNGTHAEAAPLQARKTLTHYPRMLMGHRLQAYQGKVTLLIDETSHGKVPNWAWEGAHPGALEVHIVPGNHLSYIREHAAHVARKLGELISSANSVLP